MNKEEKAEKIEGLTTIRISNETKSRLDKLKIHTRESYEEVMLNILDILNVCKNNPEKARQRLSEIEVIKAKLGKSRGN